MKRGVAPAVALVLVAGLLAVAAFAAPAAADSHASEIDSCTVIDEPGEYVLTGDIQHDAAEPCIEVRGVDVTLEGNGHAITGPGPSGSGSADSAGVAIDESGGAANVTVRNVELSGWDSGVDTDEVSQGTVRVEGATIRENGVGVSATYATGQTTITDTVIEENGAGFRGASPGAVTVRDSVVQRNDRAGFDTSESDEVELDSTVVRENGGVGVRVGGRADTVAFTNVTVADNEGTGIVAHDSGTLVSLTGATVTGNGGDGARLLFDSSVSDSRFEDNEGDGLVVGGAGELEYATVRNNGGVEFDARDGVATATALVVGDAATASFSEESVALEPVAREALPPRDGGDAVGDGIDVAGVAQGVDLELAVDGDHDSVELWHHDGSAWSTEAEGVPVNDGRVDVTVESDGTYAPGTSDADDSSGESTPTETATATPADDDSGTDASTPTPTPDATATPTPTESGSDDGGSSGGGFLGGDDQSDDDTPTPTGTETATPNETATPDPTATEEPTEQNATQTTDEPTDADDGEDDDGSAGAAPGFGPVVALLAVLASALLLYRHW